MRGHEHLNYPAFLAAAKELRSHGWSVFNPAEMDIELDGVGENAEGAEVDTPESAIAVARWVGLRVYLYEWELWK
jgi:hypothetical protein